MASPMVLGCCPESNGRFLVARVVQMYVLTNEETQVASVQLPITFTPKRPRYRLFACELYDQRCAVAGQFSY